MGATVAVKVKLAPAVGAVVGPVSAVVEAVVPIGVVTVTVTALEVLVA